MVLRTHFSRGGVKGLWGHHEGWGAGDSPLERVGAQWEDGVCVCVLVDLWIWASGFWTSIECLPDTGCVDWGLDVWTENLMSGLGARALEW